MAPSKPSTDSQGTAAQKPYVKPVLRVFGTVTALTAQLSSDKGTKDGGPNNFKT